MKGQTIATNTKLSARVFTGENLKSITFCIPLQPISSKIVFVFDDTSL
jgi:hypothetical protein